MCYRAEVVGSLLRPAYLSRARVRLAAGEIDIAGYKEIEDRAVDHAIAVQEGAGLDVVTDGEMRRFTFFDQLTAAVDGLSAVPAPPVPFHGDRPEDDIVFQSPESVTAKLKRRRMLTPEEFTYARARARRPVKVTLPSPLMLYAMWSPEHSRDAYPDPFDMFRDGAALLLEEARELAALGCTYIQIDAPELSEMLDESMREHWENLGIPVERVLGEGLEIVNAVADVPGVRFALHICRGNYESRWIARGGYEAISKRLFAALTNFDEYLLEYDTPRAGSFEPLSDLPADKVAVLGLVSTKHERLEPLGELLARVDEASRFFARDQLAVSTQCGFASVATGNQVSESAQASKLRLVAELAERAWSRT